VSIKLEHPIYHNITCRPVRLISWDLTALSAHSVYTVQFAPSESIFQIKTDIGEMVKNATDFQTSTGGKVEKNRISSNSTKRRAKTAEKQALLQCTRKNVESWIQLSAKRTNTPASEKTQRLLFTSRTVRQVGHSASVSTTMLNRSIITGRKPPSNRNTSH